MENIRILIFIILLLIPQLSFAYKIPAHERLHKKILSEYEVISGKNISTEEKEAFLRGAKDEDKMPRYINHFYDPVNDKGFKSGQPKSVLWANDPYLQASAFSLFRSKTEKLFDSAKDYSWQRAIYEYVYGDKKRAMESVGHVMHLLEDLTSVPHTRDDSHGGRALGGVSYYEDFTVDLPVKAKVKNIQDYSSIQEAFFDVAKYTNNNFLSKDTVFKKYDLPRLDLVHRKDNLLYFNNHILAYIKSKKSKRNVINRDDIKIKSPIVLQDYWKHLSQKAVDSGVSLLFLFFKEVEKEKKEKNMQYANMSYGDAKKILNKFRNVIYGKGTLFGGLDLVTYLDIDNSRYYKLKGALFTDTFYKILNKKERKLAYKAIEDYETSVLGRKVEIKKNLTASVLNALPEKEKTTQTVSKKQSPKVAVLPKVDKKNIKVLKSEKKKDELIKKPEEKTKKVKKVKKQEVPKDNFNNNHNFLRFSAASGGVPVGAGGGAGVSNKPKINISTDISSVFTDNPVTISGTASGANEIELQYGSVSYVTSTIPWSFDIDLKEGTSTVKIKASNSKEFSEKTFDVFFNARPEIQISTDCIENTGNVCKVFEGNHILNISASSDVTDMYINGYATSTFAYSTSTDVFAGVDKILTVSVKDKYSSATSSITLSAIKPDLRINEIMLRRKSGSNIDHVWLEIKNGTSYDVPLSAWSLRNGSNSVNLTGIIGKNSFFVIEDTNDAVKLNSSSKDIDLDIRNLLSSGTTLELRYGSTTVDSITVPDSYTGDYISSERVPNTDYFAFHKCILNTSVTYTPTDNYSYCSTIKADNENTRFIHTSDILTDNLTLDSGVYIIPYKPFKINAGASLLLNGDVVLKFVSGAGIEVYGSLTNNASSTTIFTSMKDDIQEDTNKDGNVSLPGAGDWDGIDVLGGDLNLHNAQFKYGNGGNDFIKITSGDLLLDNVEISHFDYGTNPTAIDVESGTFNLLNSIVDGGKFGLHISNASSTISNNLFKNQTYAGVYGNSDTNLVKINSNTFENIPYVSSWDYPSSVEFKDNSSSATSSILVNPYTYSSATSTIFEGNSGIIYEFTSAFRFENANVSFNSGSIIKPHYRIEFASSTVSMDNVVFDTSKNLSSWNGLLFENSSLNANNVEIYGAGKFLPGSSWAGNEAGMSFINSVANISNSTFGKNSIGIYAGNSNLLLQSVNFVDNIEDIRNASSTVDIR